MTDEIPKFDKWSFVDEAYSEEFLAKLGDEFDFAGRAPEFAKEFRGLGVRYFADIEIFGDDSVRTERREEFRRLKRHVAGFSEFLHRPEYADLSADLYLAALKAGAEPPKTNFPDLSEFEKTRGAPFLAELFRLVRLLEIAADDGIKHLSPPKGRKRNYPVENFVRRAAFVWTHLLGRPFTVDYNQGVGASRAFVFVRTLLDQLDADVPDSEIITGMRTVSAELRGTKQSRKSAPKKNSE